MIKILIGLAFLLSNGKIIDTKFKIHKYDKENYTKIFRLNNKEHTYVDCIKHSELEEIKKLKYNHPNDGEKTNYKVSKYKK
jgi:hypothetical protein|tara:strand:- start:179 stop:421 length:243 start_codon:yes stop_codon:yes gene_type:complete